MVTACLMMSWIVLTGCGVQDKALAIPIAGQEMEDSVAKSDGIEKSEVLVKAESDDGETGEDFVNADGVSGSMELPMIYVYVCGAVKNPGVVELPEGSRADDALRAVGGFAEDAQTDYVNLAVVLTDGEKLYFPNAEEAENLVREEQTKQDVLVNINTADLAALMTLPGIGESKAQDIISYREAHGDFQKKEDLKKIPGIKENIYSKLCEKIVIQ